MMSRSQLNRRRFLKTTVAAGFGAGFAISGTKSSGRIVGANDTIRIAVAGLNGRGGSHIGEFGKMSGVEIVYLIDPDTRTYKKRLDQIAKLGGKAPATAQDVRKVLEDPSIDAVSVATPNHWHSLITIWACQAGKDVYVEKPCSHNVHEGRIAVEAARRYKRIVQHGTQSRSSRDWARAVEVIQSGQLGKLQVSRALCYKSRESIGQKPTGTPPEQVAFDIWLGPAPEQPYHANLVHYNWHWFWDFGNGDIGNQGVHQMDIARWMIAGAKGSSATYPQSVQSLGGRFGYKDQGETPNTQVTVMDYGDTQLIFEVRGLKTAPYHGEKVGNIAHLEAGDVVGDKFFPKDGSKPVPVATLVKAEVKRGPGRSHFDNFIAAVRSRNAADLNADILEGHYSAALCHLANISYRLGVETTYDGATKAFGDDKAAHETVERMAEHLKADALPVDGLKYRVGPKLAFDAASESFTGDSQANALLTRAYRSPYVVPDRLT